MFGHLSDSEIAERSLALKVSECHGALHDVANQQKYAKLAEEQMARDSVQSVNMVNIAKMHYNLNQNEMAIHIFQEIGDDEIRKHSAEFIAAHCYQLMDDKERSIKYYQMGLERAPDGSAHDAVHRQRALHNMGCAHHDLGHYDDAKRCFDALPPNHIVSSNLEFVVAVNLHRLGQWKEVCRLWTHSLF